MEIINNNNKNGKMKQLVFKPYNFGLAFLKMILALTVIGSHCFKNSSTNNNIFLFFYKRRRIHVPSFMIMSFYFMQKSLISSNFKLLCRRLIRLGIPYLCWPIIIFFLNNNILNLLGIGKKILLYDLINQLLWGESFIIQFWFQWDLFFITILFFILISFCRKNHLFVLQLLGILSYVLQYSEYNLKFYKKIGKNCLGRIAEMVPYATTGFTFGTYKTIDYLKKYKYKTFILSLLIFILTDKYNIFIRPNGIAYSGIKHNIRAICLIFLFSLLSLENIKNKLLFNIIKELSNYTAGIFYLHWTVSIF